MNRSPAEPIELLKTLLPAVMALVGVAGFYGVAAGDIRGRYQLAADVLVYSSLLSVVCAIFAATYPFALEGPVRSLRIQGRRWAEARKHQERFNEWLRLWRAYSALLYGSYDADWNEDYVRRADAKYAQLRPWLVEHEDVPREALKVIGETFDIRWRRRTTSEYNLITRGFFYFLQCDEVLRMNTVLHIDADIGPGERGHHPQMTLMTIWDGLNRYSVAKGWGSIDNWDEVVRLSKEPSPAQSIDAGVLTSA